ncbi:hypothetical protein Cgig2_023473 [Carnegiea gigantea]|uniref:Cell division cycle protein 123 homolog n=1 Tax=Carnegiea gigantea TaxID=171969 RepID=A0A9Q1JQC4_9CARY|nr:hypothetical protein Cgig2_023473 [Carnegiea gigantea]
MNEQIIADVAHEDMSVLGTDSIDVIVVQGYAVALGSVMQEAHYQSLTALRMKQEEVNRCQIQEWYPQFKPVSIKTIIHELPESFIQYLLEDSGPFLLPTSVSNEDALPNRIHKPEDEEEFEVAEGLEDESEKPPLPPSFPYLEMKIKESIESLGGAVFPKPNWSSPKDTAWISPTGTLKCTSFNDISLLLRSSDSVVHDLCHAYDSCSDKTLSRPLHFYLALRKWYPSLRPEMEFRCFVRAGQLVGISQREGRQEDSDTEYRRRTTATEGTTALHSKKKNGWGLLWYKTCWTFVLGFGFITDLTLLRTHVCFPTSDPSTTNLPHRQMGYLVSGKSYQSLAQRSPIFIPPN